VSLPLATVRPSAWESSAFPEAPYDRLVAVGKA